MSNTLRPLGLGEIIDTAFQIYRRHWRALFLLVAVVVVPAGIASYLVLDAAVPPDFTEQFAIGGELDEPPLEIDEELLTTMLRFLGAAVLAAAIEGAAALLAAAAAVRAVGEIYLGIEPDWRRSLQAAAGRLPAILLTGLLIAAALAGLAGGVALLTAITASTGGRALVALAVLAWVVLVPWLVVSWAPAIPVLVVEKASPTAALGRSFGLVRRRWWPTFGTLLTAWLIIVVLSAIASRILEAFLPTGESLLLSMVVSLVVSVATTPFLVCVLAVLYFDLRTRKEHFNLARLARDIGEAPPPPPPASSGPELPDQPDWPPLPPDPGDEPFPPLR